MTFRHVVAVAAGAVLAADLVAGAARPPGVVDMGHGRRVAAAVPESGVAKPAARAASALAAAFGQARRSGRRVEVMSLRTQTSQVFANPGGTLTLTEYAQPVRVRLGRSWVAVDTRLRLRPDGTVGPIAAVGGLSLSDGGTGPLARLANGARRVAVWWPWRLPVPVLSGDTATYPAVLPGVDLRVRASVDGFAEVLVVRNRAAAADPRLTRIRLAMATAGVRVRASRAGGLALDAPGGKAVFAAARPVMWDSRGSGVGARTAPMGLRVGRNGVTVVPDRAMLTARGTRFPLFIDPAVSLGLAAWGNVTAAAPDQTMSNDPFRSEGAKAGLGCDSTGCFLYRSAFEFGMGALDGTNVLSATFSITMYHSWSCSATPTQLWQTGFFGESTATWNNMDWLTYLDTQSAAANSQTCGQSPVDMVFSGGLASQLHSAALNGAPDIALGLLAPNESTTTDWKRFNANPVLSVTYNSWPNTPDNLTVDGKPCVTGAGRPYIADLTPTLTAHVSDPDAGQLLEANFYGGPLGGTLTHWVSQGNLANGGTASIKVPPGILADGGVYTFHAYTDDGINGSNWSASCEFGVDVTPPNPPAQITSTDYPSDGTFHGMEGMTGHFVFTPPASHPEDVAAYLVGLNRCNQPTCATVYPAAADHSGAADITPNLAGPNTLNVWTRDKAGNLSNAGQPVTYQFDVHSPGPPAAQYPMSEGGGATTADATGHGNTATLTGGVTFTKPSCTAPASGGPPVCTDAGRRGAGPALSLDGSTGYAATAGPLTTADPNNPANQIPVRTDQSFTVSAWLNPADVTAGTSYPTAVSADGAHASAFMLQHSPGPGAVWVFSMTQSDANGTPVVNLMGTSPVRVGAWTHVAGSYDAATKAMRLYVNGVLEAAITIPGTFNATGPLVIGRAKSNSAPNGFWHGQIDDVRFDSRLLSDAEIGALANAPVLVGDWELGEGGGATAHDTSGVSLPADATLTGSGVTWVPVDPADARPSDGGLPPGANALHFESNGRLLPASGPMIVDTSRSFSFAVWVRLTTTVTGQNILGINGVSFPGFQLMYQHTNDWAFEMSKADTSPFDANWAVAASVTPAVGTWTHLAGVFDAETHTMKLYVDGTLAGTGGHTSTFTATGPVLIGLGQYNGADASPWLGDLASVQVYSGVLSDQQIANLAGA